MTKTNKKPSYSVKIGREDYDRIAEEAKKFARPITFHLREIFRQHFARG